MEIVKKIQKLSELNTPSLTQGRNACLILEPLGELLNFHFFFLKTNTEQNAFVKRNTNNKYIYF